MPFYMIKEAIRSGHRIKLYLAKGEYVVEPHVLGRNRHYCVPIRVVARPAP